ncbi:hypothetical protein [Flammeovirga sp. EKP202]|uniref:hypothetical protein n=1 Tax=Flammeovirga sp. EKP202 TaxID=2770592 RepID=UPI00165EF634|nr:hypothetical protein [Flammeovirga sp. EKP202]MBD0403461.1 hypothetical protein [Flammeovirga sp. EKP202]
MEFEKIKEQAIECFKTFKDSKVIFSSQDGKLIVPQTEQEAISLNEQGYIAIFKEDLKKDLGTDGLGLFY